MSIKKSISRFARNTVDLLKTVRHLKTLGIEVRFEKENIWTLDAKGELLITIMSSLAQEESRSISENTTWGQRKRFADGRVSVAYSRFLGYDRGLEGGFVINPEQAETVRLIYSLFLSGLSLHSVATQLTKRGLKTPAGKDKWSQSTVKSILTNEKYKADAYKKWRRSRDEEVKVMDDFKDPNNPLQIVIVTSRLLTGFDAPILQVMYLDKPMKDHTLLQAICRTNRLYNQDKNYGLIVDFVGIFDDVAKAMDIAAA